MNSYLKIVPPRLFSVTLLAVSFAFAGHARALSQTQQPEPAATASAQPAAAQGEATAAETEAAQRRLSRARSLAAIGKLAAAASELEALRSSTREDSVRDVARVLLMAVCVEMPDYPRAATLLDEAFNARTKGQTDDAATHAYFALAGQMTNSVRTHLDRYRSFGVNVTNASELPSEANGDLEQLRNLLERLSAQAKALREEQLKGDGAGARGLDAAALLEDAATVRMRIPRHEEDRAQWQSVVSEARSHLFSSEMRVASIGDVPAARPAPAATQTAAPAKTSAAEQTNSTKAGAQPKGAQPTAAAQGSNAQAAPAQPQQAGAARPSDGGARSAAAPVAVGPLAAKARQKFSPSYPSIAKAARVSGVVTVYLVVNEKGEVETVQKLEGPAQLQQAAADAARRWRFNPTLVDGQPVRVTGYLSFNFAL